MFVKKRYLISFEAGGSALRLEISYHIFKRKVKRSFFSLLSLNLICGVFIPILNVKKSSFYLSICLVLSVSVLSFSYPSNLGALNSGLLFSFSVFIFTFWIRIVKFSGKEHLFFFLHQII